MKTARIHKPKKIDRRYSDNPKNMRVTVQLDQATFHEIKLLRGKETAPEWIRKAIQERIDNCKCPVSFTFNPSLEFLLQESH